MKSFEEITVSLNLSIGYSIAQHKENVYLHEYINEKEWKKLNIFEKDEFVRNEILNEWANGYIEISADINN